MNILHIKYAVEVAKSGSVSKAAEKLLMAQPNLSRAIKELESDLGIEIFVRTTRGTRLTAQGEEFIGYAQKILTQVEEIEQLYKNGYTIKKKFSISVPRATYISDAFANFSTKIGSDPAEIFYKETNSSRIINNLLHSDYKLGIIRYAQVFEKYFQLMFEEKGLKYDPITTFRYLLLFSRNSPLAHKKEIKLTDIEHYTEVAHADPFVPSLPFSEVKKEELSQNIKQRIFVFERASQFDLLSENPNTFMWVSPVSDKVLDRYELIQVDCPENKKIYKDVLVYRKDYVLSSLDKIFIDELIKSRNKYIGSVEE